MEIRWDNSPQSEKKAPFMDQVFITMMGQPYHLLPIAERLSYKELENREFHFLDEERTVNFNLPAPAPLLRLSVVVPVYNEEKNIIVLLRCMEAQKLAADQFEVLVVNNHSSDHSAEEVIRFSKTSRITVHLIEEPERGCLRAVRTGMDLAVQRLHQVSPCNCGWISIVDADDQVGPDWAGGMILACNEHHADFIRGRTQTYTSLPPRVETLMKTLCDAENRINGYAELVRQRFEEALRGDCNRTYPRWIPRITGPNFVISRAAYIAVGGLDPRPPGDQTSHLANPLLRQGGVVVQLDQSDIVLFRSCREFFRNFSQAGGYGAGFGIGFGDMLSRARNSKSSKKEIEYPNPALVEIGFNEVLNDYQSADQTRQLAGHEFMLRFLGSPPDPNTLYSRVVTGALPPSIPLSSAKSVLVAMTKRLDGIDYRAAERFFQAREHLRLEILKSKEKTLNPDRILKNLIARMSFTGAELPQHVVSILNRLQELPDQDVQKWFDHACQEMENNIFSAIHQ